MCAEGVDMNCFQVEWNISMEHHGQPLLKLLAKILYRKEKKVN